MGGGGVTKTHVQCKSWKPCRDTHVYRYDYRHTFRSNVDNVFRVFVWERMRKVRRVEEEVLMSCTKKHALTPNSGSSSAGSSGRRTRYMCRARNMCYIVLLAGAGGLAP